MTIHRYETSDPCGLARKLVTDGKADRNDRLETLDAGKPSLNGSIGWFADHNVRETATSGPRFVKWTPFPVATYRSQTPNSEPEAE